MRLCPWWCFQLNKNVPCSRAGFVFTLGENGCMWWWQGTKPFLVVGCIGIIALSLEDLIPAQLMKQSNQMFSWLSVLSPSHRSNLSLGILVLRGNSCSSHIHYRNPLSTSETRHLSNSPPLAHHRIHVRSCILQGGHDLPKSSFRKECRNEGYVYLGENVGLRARRPRSCCLCHQRELKWWTHTNSSQPQKEIVTL